jgi:endonuclease YncB( thermonuclease family)
VPDGIRSREVAMKAIEQLRSGLTVGHAQTAMHGNRRGTVGQVVHDGDTIALDPLGGLSVRFLGVDAPEVSFTLPGGTPDRFVPITDEAWKAVLDDPLSASLPPFDPPLTGGLRGHLAARAGTGAAANHAELARDATLVLRDEVTRDMTELGQDANQFQFFLAFAGEVMDRYGRLLCYLNRHEPHPGPGGRPDTYNERLLAAGWVTPYFIWPNINPFRRATTTVAAVPRPGTAHELAERESSLRNARAWVAAARASEIGLYQPGKVLQLFPFELRFLARSHTTPSGAVRRSPPDRWVINLTSDDDHLYPPHAYWRIPHPEDRLFVPAEYVPLFIDRGWKKRRA